MRATLITILFAVGTSVSYALAPDTVWTRTYGTEDSEYARALVRAREGGYALAGIKYNSGEPLIFLIRTDDEGDTLWTRTYDGPFGNDVFDLIQTTDDGFVIVGYAGSGQPDQGFASAYIVKTDSQGDTLWTTLFSTGQTWTQWESAIESEDEGVVLAGWSGSIPQSGGIRVLLQKIGSDGVPQWTSLYGGASYDYVYSVLRSRDGGYAAAGTLERGDIFLFKVNELGDSSWSRTYGGSNADRCYSAVNSSDCGYLLCGNTWSFGSGAGDFYAVKTDSLGNEEWSQFAGGTDWDEAYSAIECIDHGFAIVGTTWSFGVGLHNIYVVRLSEAGDTLWTGNYGGEGYDDGVDIVQADDGNFALLGTTTSFGASARDMLLVKTASESITIRSQLDRVPHDFTLHANFPNPFNLSTTIQFDLTRNTEVTLSVIDIQGRIVKTLLDHQNLSAGVYTRQFDASSFSSGVYFYSLETPSQHQTRKMVMMK